MITLEQLSEEQKVAYDYVLDFINSPKRQMLLSGYAGTGKTTLISLILEHLERKTFLEYICTAPTNEALRVLSKMSGGKYNKTIYSLLGLQLVEVDDKPPILKPSRDSQLNKYDVIFIDESSMIQEELFDLIQKEVDLFSRLKIIYIGDSAQLPPVNDKGKDSKVFDLEYKVQLTEVQRTAKENPIINIVTDIRNALSASEDVFETKTIYNDESKQGIVFHTDKHEYLKLIYDDFKSPEYAKDSNFVKVLAYTNKTVNTLNKLIREEIFGKKDLPQFVEKDKLIVDEPITDGKGNIVYTVGERLEVLKVTEKFDEEDNIKFWNILVQNYDSIEGDTTIKRINVVDRSYLKAYKQTLAKYANIAKERASDKSMKMSKKDAWEPYFSFKNQYSWVKYSMALTIHKSQGSTFKNVYVINSDCDILTWNNVERNKLKYVAFTRASHLVRVV